MATAKDTAEILESVLEKYEPVIGLEVHVQLLTRTKIFCGCSTKFGAPPNSNVCPVCLGMPGALPVLNREAVAMAVKAALALHCRINPLSRFARKNYFYPDLPKGYQISQFDQPVAEHGRIRIHGASFGEKRIGITRLHLEEDAGKSIHDGFPDSHEKSYVDLNRSGVPLIEIVSEPDLRSSDEAYDYLTRLKQILLYLGVSDCNMEEGSLRCDANVSVRPRGQEKFGVKAEVKNLNSFRFLQKALDYEIARQAQVLDGGGVVMQETRLWNTQTQKTTGMRSKEFAHDYRYFPEPDLLPLVISDEWQKDIRRSIPELPEAKRNRFVEQYLLREYDADVLTATQELADYYEDVIKAWKVLADDRIEEIPIPVSPKVVANWLMRNGLATLKSMDDDFAGFRAIFSPEKVAVILEKQVGIPAEKINELTNYDLQRISKLAQITARLSPKAQQKIVDYMNSLDANQIQESVVKGYLIETIKSGSISQPQAVKIWEEMAKTGERPEEIIERLGLRQVTDENEILGVVRKVIAANPKQAEQYRSGKTALFGFFVGQVMKETKGQANPQKVNELLKEELERT